MYRSCAACSGCRWTRENKKDISMRLPPDFNAEGWELIGFVQHTADGHISNAGRTGFETK